MTKSNRLAKESSPYLKQHATNPVDWYPWGSEAFSRSKKENKPILLSIGYASCHWCHVMAHESFEDDTIAALMNEKFVNIKVDREERPDVDEVYMEAVQIITRHGGWPLTVFLTPDLKPFYGGTYFPPVSRYGHPSFKDVLTAVAAFYENNIDERNERAESLFSLLSRQEKLDPNLESPENLQAAHQELLKSLYLDADLHQGGFGRAPKFPQPCKLNALLFSKQNEHRMHVAFTLEKLARGGIYDQLGGGIARYSVDASWTVPHFEKMLYDNAQMLALFAATSRLNTISLVTQKRLEGAAHGVFRYLEDQLRDTVTSLYCCAEDADSEGEEGRYYVFYADEFREAFSGDDDLIRFAEAYFSITEEGNFEGANVLTRRTDENAIKKRFSLTDDELSKKIEASKSALLNYRNKRERPQRDNKCLLSWNALAISALVKASICLADEQMARRSKELLTSVLNCFFKQNLLMHVAVDGVAKIEAFADDVAFLLLAMVDVMCFWDDKSLVGIFEKVCVLCESSFIDKETRSFYFAKPDEFLKLRSQKRDDSIMPSPAAACYEAAVRFKVWAQSRGIAFGDSQVIETLASVSAASLSSLSRAAPLATPHFLQSVAWEATQVAVSVENADAPTRLGALRAAFDVLLNCGHGNALLMWNSPSVGQGSNNLSVTYALCTRDGCQLPTTRAAELAAGL